MTHKTLTTYIDKNTGYRMEEIQGVLAGRFWRAAKLWRGHEIHTGYGDTADEAIAHLERIMRSMAA